MNQRTNEKPDCLVEGCTHNIATLEQNVHVHVHVGTYNIDFPEQENHVLKCVRVIILLE